MRYFWNYVGRTPFDDKIDQPSVDVYQNRTVYEVVFALKRKIPAKAYYYFSRLLGNEKMKKEAEERLKTVEKCKDIAELYSSFTTNEWIFETFNSFELQFRLSEEDLSLFKINISELNWKNYFPIFSYGMQKYIMKQEVEPPFLGKGNIINKRPRFLADLMFVYAHGKDQKTKNFNQTLKNLLNSERVSIAIRQIVTKHQIDSHLSEEELISVEQQKVHDILKRMMAKMDFKKMRMLGYVIHKVYKSMYEMVVVNRNMIEKIRQLNEKSDGNVIYCPTHRSYVDFLVLSYVLYANDIKVPHI
jgi:hypothetical protein